MTEFYNALTGANQRADADPKHLFGQFVGEWDFEWIDGKGTVHERHVPGEWIFSWILNGKAVQDLFICPSRKEKERLAYPDSEYGTTIRIYNAEKQKWDVCYGYDGKMYVLEAERVGDDIVLTNQDKSEGLNQWLFTEITPTSFHWLNQSSADAGKTWRINGELYAKRRV